MTNQERELAAQIRKNARIQKESSVLVFKQDSRRTALQLSERCTKGNGLNHPQPNEILLNAELFYEWLINEKAYRCNEKYMETGLIEYANKSK